MDIKKIKSLEYANDFRKVHLFYNPFVDMWIAYGYSAYSLRLYVKALNYDCLRGLSNTMEMPCTVVTSATAKAIRRDVTVLEDSDDYMLLTMPEPFDKNDYVRWTRKLNQENELKAGMNIKTKVSDFVPKNKFIQDNMSSFSRIGKRIGDFIIAAVCLVIFSPLFLICYILIKRFDGGPAIYKQERIGRFGKPFYIYKFRSMSLDAEKLGPQLSHSCGRCDPRITKVGLFLRTHHLDELPQLWNVLCGDMSFVGHRPERKFYIDQIMEYDKRYAYLYQIRPGVTSYATLYNGYTDTMEKMLCRLEYDLYYLQHRSLTFDVKILFHTFCNIVFGKRF